MLLKLRIRILKPAFNLVQWIFTFAKYFLKYMNNLQEHLIDIWEYANPLTKSPQTSFYTSG